MGLPILIAGVSVAAASIYSVVTKQKQMSQKRSESDLPHHAVQVSLPDWARKELPIHYAKTYTTDEEMMALAVHLSSENVKQDTGGPFGSAIFERITTNTSTDGTDSSTLKLVSIGVNRVVTLGNSTLHGETVAIQLAQSKLRSFTMQLAPEICIECNDNDGSNESKSDPTDTPICKEMRQFELFTSCEPCAMCLGATLWSGVSRIVCGATKKDAEAIGFDEGPVFDESYEHLKRAGIDVKRSVLQAEAAKVLQEYGRKGLIYN